MHQNAVHALARGSSIGPNATRADVGPWPLIDADTHLEFLNVAVPVTRIDDAPRAIERAVAWFRQRGTRFCFLLRDYCDEIAIARLHADGYRTEHTLPALVCDPLPAPAPAPEGIEIGPVTTADELAAYASVGGEEQGIDRDTVSASARGARTTPGFTLLLGRVDGVAVATSLALVHGDVVGIYNVNVLPVLRRRGFGEAMTGAAIEVGRSQGCRAAFLESTPISHRLYENMGFRTRYQYLQIAR